jgi:RNase P/RNase MRP subunit POP5
LKRTKRRYLAVQVYSSEAVDSRELMDAVWASILKLFGEYGASLANLALIDYDMEKRVVVLRTSLTALNMVRAAITPITVVADKQAALHVLAVSGTIKALHKRLPP